jgi:hypothetical protein
MGAIYIKTNLKLKIEEISSISQTTLYILILYAYTCIERIINCLLITRLNQQTQSMLYPSILVIILYLRPYRILLKMALRDTDTISSLYPDIKIA